MCREAPTFDASGLFGSGSTGEGRTTILTFAEAVEAVEAVVVEAALAKAASAHP